MKDIIGKSKIKLANLPSKLIMNKVDVNNKAKRFNQWCYRPISWQNFQFFFEKEQFTLVVFIDLPKTFNTIDHSTLLKKLTLYSTTDKNVAWFESYLSNRKQYIQKDENSKKDLTYVTCVVTQGSILGPLLFLVYVNDLPNASCLLNQLCLPMILIFSLIIMTLNNSLQL